MTKENAVGTQAEIQPQGQSLDAQPAVAPQKKDLVAPLLPHPHLRVTLYLPVTQDWDHAAYLQVLELLQNTAKSGLSLIEGFTETGLTHAHIGLWWDGVEFIEDTIVEVWVDFRYQGPDSHASIQQQVAELKRNVAVCYTRAVVRDRTAAQKVIWAYSTDITVLLFPLEGETASLPHEPPVQTLLDSAKSLGLEHDPVVQMAKPYHRLKPWQLPLRLLADACGRKGDHVRAEQAKTAAGFPTFGNTSDEHLEIAKLERTVKNILDQALAPSAAAVHGLRALAERCKKQALRDYRDQHQQLQALADLCVDSRIAVFTKNAMLGYEPDTQGCSLPRQVIGIIDDFLSTAEQATNEANPYGFKALRQFARDCFPLLSDWVRHVDKWLKSGDEEIVRAAFATAVHCLVVMGMDEPKAEVDPTLEQTKPLPPEHTTIARLEAKLQSLETELEAVRTEVEKLKVAPVQDAAERSSVLPTGPGTVDDRS